MKKAILLIISMSFLIYGCGSTAYNRSSSTYSREVISESLFNDKDRTLTESDIQKLLEGRLQLPDTLRLAVFKFGMNNQFYSKFNYYGADENLVKAQQSYIDTLVAGLKTNSKVVSVHPIPSLMLSVTFVFFTSHNKL